MNLCIAYTNEEFTSEIGPSGKVNTSQTNDVLRAYEEITRKIKTRNIIYKILKKKLSYVNPYSS